MATTSRTRACIDCTRNATTWEGACLLTFGAIVDHLLEDGLLPIAAPITPRCESVILDRLLRRCDCPNAAAWLACCPCGENSYACNPCHQGTLARPADWCCELCGRGPLAWTWRPL